MDYSQFFDAEKIIPYLIDQLTTYGPKVLSALAIFIIGRWSCKIVSQMVKRVLKKSKVDDLLISFVGSISYMGLLVFVIIAALNQLGVQTTSFVAIIGAAGLAIGLALQGALSNFAAGVLMIIFRPFKSGDYIEGGGVSGVVGHIQIFTTELLTPDNKLVIVPNANMMSSNITNYSANKTRRVDLVIGVGYGDDLSKVKHVLQTIVDAEPRVLKSPAATIAVSELADNSVNLVVRPWVKTADYWDIYFHLTETIKVRFDEENISIPYPQRDVHMIN